MTGTELRALAKMRGDDVHVLDDGEYELGGVHYGHGYQAKNLYQDVLAVINGEEYHIFSINYYPEAR